RRPLPTEPVEAPSAYMRQHEAMFQHAPGTPFLVTAPLYHVGPLSMVMTDVRLGGTALVFEKFDAEKVLAAIDQHGVRRGQFVPRMFTRMLKLPAEVRARYDVSSIVAAMHSAAPCPVDVKTAMIDWWGPVLIEIYGGTEGAGNTFIDSQAYLRKPGSV